MTYNAGERAHVRQAEKLQARLTREKGEIITNLMSTTAGRAWICSLLEGAHVFASSFDRDPVAMAFNEGERNQGLILLNDILAFCPDQYILMMRESNERHLASERARGENTDGGDQEPGGTVPADTDTTEPDTDPGPGAYPTRTH